MKNPIVRSWWSSPKCWNENSSSGSQVRKTTRGPAASRLQQGVATTSTTSTDILPSRRNRDVGNVAKSQTVLTAHPNRHRSIQSSSRGGVESIRRGRPLGHALNCSTPGCSRRLTIQVGLPLQAEGPQMPGRPGPRETSAASDHQRRAGT